jgi:hypothetical protein
MLLETREEERGRGALKVNYGRNGVKIPAL